jgi:hypothetical protein
MRLGESDRRTGREHERRGRLPVEYGRRGGNRTERHPNGDLLRQHGLVRAHLVNDGLTGDIQALHPGFDYGGDLHGLLLQRAGDQSNEHLRLLQQRVSDLLQQSLNLRLSGRLPRGHGCV